MLTPPHKILAEALIIAKSKAKDGIIQSDSLSRTQRERLLKAGCLQEIMKGWYLLTTPEYRGGSTAWFSGYWAFLNQYLSSRFGNENYCLSPESSLYFHSGHLEIPKQIIVHTKKKTNSIIKLPYETIVVCIVDSYFPEERLEHRGIQMMTIALALCRTSPSYFQQYPSNIEMILKLSETREEEISRILLKSGSIASAERIIGAYRQIGNSTTAERLQKDLETAGYKIKNINPFHKYHSKIANKKLKSPYTARIEMMWSDMRKAIIEEFKNTPLYNSKIQKNMKEIREKYIHDAYHSLSIEGYQVTETLISQIQKGDWHPESSDEQNMLNILSAKGYELAFEEVLKSIGKSSSPKHPGNILEKDLHNWYRELFSPLFKLHYVPIERISGYRNGPVYITGSRHVPPQHTVVPECMDTLFKLLKQEDNAAVRAILGHFIFVFIHPYLDGNGRIARFLMNFMFVTAGYPWTIVHVENRKTYMTSLEKASTTGKISDFAKFIHKELKRNFKNKSLK